MHNGPIRSQTLGHTFNSSVAYTNPVNYVHVFGFGDFSVHFVDFWNEGDQSVIGWGLEALAAYVYTHIMKAQPIGYMYVCFSLLSIKLNSILKHPQFSRK